MRNNLKGSPLSSLLRDILVLSLIAVLQFVALTSLSAAERFTVSHNMWEPRLRIVQELEIPEPIQSEEEIEVEETEPVIEDRFSYYTNMIKDAAKEVGVDYKLAVAISRLETGNWTSRAFEAWNFGGLTSAEGVMAFESCEAGLEAYMATLSWYQSIGLTTVEEMASVYCPENEAWCTLVREIMGEVA